MKSNRIESTDSKGHKEKKSNSDDEIIEKSHPVLKSPTSIQVTTEAASTKITRNQRWGTENKR